MILDEQHRITRCIELGDAFNNIGQTLENKTEKEAFIQQYKIIAEEVKELYDAVADEDKTETLDAICDALVTTARLIAMAQHFGYDVLGAWEAVCDNNLEKYTTSETIAAYSVGAYKEAGEDVTATHNEEYGVYVLKDSRGKIRKPIGFRPVNLEAFLPKE